MCVCVAGGSGCIWGVTADFQHVYFIFLYFIFPTSRNPLHARARADILGRTDFGIDHEQTLCGEPEPFGDRGGPEGALR